MTHIDPCDTARNNVLAAVLALQRCTKTAANIVPIPGQSQIIAIGTMAEVARLLELEPADRLASQSQAAPVGWREFLEEMTMSGKGMNGSYWIPRAAALLAAPPNAREAQAEPEGWKSQRKMIERAIIGLRDGWATRKDADDALAALGAAPAVTQEATAQGEQVGGDELVRFCPHCASIGEVDEEYRDCCPDGSTARHIPKHLAEVCRNTFKLAIGSIGAPAKPMTSEEERAEAAKKSDWCPHCGQGWHCASQLATTPSRAAADEVRDAALDEVADHLEALSDSCGDAAARDQREMNLYEEERMHAIQHCANVVRGLKRANDTGEQA